MKTESHDFLDDMVDKQKKVDLETRKMAEEIVEARNLKTLDEAKRFAQAWIETAAQHARNEKFWRELAEKQEESCCHFDD